MERKRCLSFPSERRSSFPPKGEEKKEGKRSEKRKGGRRKRQELLGRKFGQTTQQVVKGENATDRRVSQIKSEELNAAQGKRGPLSLPEKNLTTNRKKRKGARPMREGTKVV